MLVGCFLPWKINGKYLKFFPVNIKWDRVSTIIWKLLDPLSSTIIMKSMHDSTTLSVVVYIDTHEMSIMSYVVRQCQL